MAQIHQTIGIDLGTTFSAIATINSSGRPEIVNNPQGKSLTPSVIYFGNAAPLIGDEAKEMQALGEAEIAAFFKRNMGDKHFVLDFNNKNYNATDLSALLLSTLKQHAESALNTSISQAVITVPAYFNNFQREATLQAGQMAGLQVFRIINEPTAAALAYGLQKDTHNQTALVYDLGGGTFDVTVVDITKDAIQVLATDGDHELGGKDWDDRIATFLGQRFLEDYGVDPLEDTVAFNDLLVRCENAKKQLSQRDKARIVITHQGEKATYELSRDEFANISRDLMERTQLLTEQVLRDAGLNWSQLTGVLLVGGSTRMPMVADYVTEMSSKPPMTGVNVDEAVALGAAIQADLDANGAQQTRFTLAGPKQIQDVMSHSLGMVAENADRSRYINSIIIPKNTRIPCTETHPFQLRTTRQQDNELEVYMLQGESDTPTQCVVLGLYKFSKITYVAGKPAIIDIAYAYDANGVVKVSATERATGQQLPMQETQPDDMGWLSQPPPPPVVVSVELSILLVIDVSYSMEGAPLAEAKKAAKAFVKKSDLSHTSIGVIEFGSAANSVIKLTKNAKNINHAIELLAVSGGTNMTEGLKIAHKQLQNIEDPRFIVLLTDGYPNDATTTEQEARAICAAGIELITVGTGGADKAFLKRLACSDEQSIFAQAGSVVDTFSSIAQVITESGGGVHVSDSGQRQKSGLLSFFR